MPCPAGGLSWWWCAAIFFVAVCDLVVAARYPETRSSLPRSGVRFRIDVNHADQATLCLLPGIGPRLAKAVVQDRQEEGLYRHVEDLGRAHGVGPQKVLRLKPYAMCAAVPGGHLLSADRASPGQQECGTEIGFGAAKEPWHP